MGSIEKWIDFFQKAGLPKDAANTYAHSFLENRITMTMLADLNKEYLREMGIYRTGDIILILKQAKFEQEKRRLGVASGAAKQVKRSYDEEDEEEMKPVQKRKLTSVADKRPEPKPVERRVISQKVSDSEEELPSIKKKVVPAVQRTTSVLKNARVSQEVVASRPAIPVRTVTKQNSGSIFDRLGSKSIDPPMVNRNQPPNKQSTTPQRITLVKKVPAKATYASETSSEEEITEDEDEYVNISGGKAVKFSRQDEIIEIKGPKKGLLRNRLAPGKTNSVKSRLGQKVPVKTTSLALARMRLQASPLKKQILKIGTLKSDEITQRKNKTIHDRLFAKGGRSPTARSPVKKQIVNVNRKVIRVAAKNGKSGLKNQINVKQSVFDRLGFSNGRNK